MLIELDSFLVLSFWGRTRFRVAKLSALSVSFNRERFTLTSIRRGALYACVFFIAGFLKKDFESPGIKHSANFQVSI
jgi:hypothetical protein